MLIQNFIIKVLKYCLVQITNYIQYNLKKYIRIFSRFNKSRINKNNSKRSIRYIIGIIIKYNDSLSQ